MVPEIPFHLGGESFSPPRPTYTCTGSAHTEEHFLQNSYLDMIMYD